MLPQRCTLHDRGLTALVRAEIDFDVACTQPSVVEPTGLEDKLVEVYGLTTLGAAEMCVFFAHSPVGN